MKHSIAVLSCAALLVASLTGCGGSDEKSTLPADSGGSSSSATTTSAPTTAAPTATATGPVALVPHTAYTFGGLKLVVNLPASMPSESRPSMRLFSDFLQADGRTTARNKLDPSLADLASAEVVKETQSSITAGSVQAIGKVSYTISRVESAGSNYTLVTGCLDQSKLVQVRKDGSHFVDAATKKHPTLKMTADINRGMTGPKVTRFTFAVGSC